MCNSQIITLKKLFKKFMNCILGTTDCLMSFQNDPLQHNYALHLMVKIFLPYPRASVLFLPSSRLQPVLKGASWFCPRPLVNLGEGWAIPRIGRVSHALECLLRVLGVRVWIQPGPPVRMGIYEGGGVQDRSEISGSSYYS